MYPGSSDSPIIWVAFTSLVLYTLGGNEGTGRDGLYGSWQTHKICYPNILIKLMGPKPEKERQRAKLRE